MIHAKGGEFIHPLTFSPREAEKFREILRGEGIDPEDGPAANDWIKEQIGVDGS